MCAYKSFLSASPGYMFAPQTDLMLKHETERYMYNFNSSEQWSQHTATNQALNNLVGDAHSCGCLLR